MMRQFDGSVGAGKVNVGPNSVVGSGILDAGQRLILDMRRTTGSGEPEQGDAFGGGALTFCDAEETVTSADPGDDWFGGAARSYADANRRQADDVASMAVLDRGVQIVIAREAEQIGYHRENLDGQANYLAHLRRATGSIGVLPGVGTAMTAAFELTAVTATLGTCTGEMDQLTHEVAENVATLQQIAGEYSALGTKSSAPAPVDEEVSPSATDGREPTPTPEAPPEASLAAESVVAPSEGTAPTMPAEAISGITSALGVVGGLIGAVVAPVAATLSGVAGAVGQSLSMLPSSAADPVAEAGEHAPEDDKLQAVDHDEIRRQERDGEASVEARPNDGSDSAVPSAESAESGPVGTDKLDPGRSPAATRPPR